MNRLNQTESAVFKLWMLYFQRISFSDYFNDGTLCFVNSQMNSKERSNNHKLIWRRANVKMKIFTTRILNGCKVRIENSVTSDGIFNHSIVFVLHTLPSTVVLKLECALLYQFYAKISIFSIKICSVRLLSATSWRHAPGRLTPPRIRRKYPERVNMAENLVGYGREYVH